LSFVSISACSDPGAYGENQEYDEAIQLSPGQHTFVAYDVYGDGWNGGTFGVSNADTGTVVVATTVFDYGFEISTAFDTPGCGSVEPPTAGHSHDDHSRVEDTTPTGPVTIQVLFGCGRGVAVGALSDCMEVHGSGAGTGVYMVCGYAWVCRVCIVMGVGVDRRTDGGCMRCGVYEVWGVGRGTDVSYIQRWCV
jgi:hypothetical protein